MEMAFAHTRHGFQENVAFCWILIHVLLEGKQKAKELCLTWEVWLFMDQRGSFIWEAA